MAHAGGLAALGAHEHHVAGVDGGFLVDDPTGLHGVARLLMLGDHVHAFHHNLAGLGVGSGDLALLALVLAGDDDYGIVFLDVKLLHCVSSIKALRVQGRLSSCSP